MRYRDFADRVRLRFKEVDLSGVHTLSWVAYFPMPKSWSKKKKAVLKGMRHESKPDRDNVDKAILDALFKDDSGISDGRLSKRWDDGNGARIEIVIS
jgi:Holliday junction resolvase RusA-like endonuclease